MKSTKLGTLVAALPVVAISKIERIKVTPNEATDDIPEGVETVGFENHAVAG